ncbi:hypothetical protein EMPS_04195 [Entomortierella parvispora]|uniref:Uncharacterized protein n=1 Tax=Entomortierella parvispora TaxID=205924 RepID=A0A9P3H881_9FUNG|nr:hypothetical protein EMPS_04195 [Entomortierella parvispora]
MTASSLLHRSSKSLQIFRLILVSLGALMLVLDIVSTVALEDSWAYKIRALPPGSHSLNRTSADMAYYSVQFLPDLFTISLYTLLVVLARRGNRVRDSPSTTQTSRMFSHWPALRVLFTLFLSGFMMFWPFKSIDSLRIFIAMMNSFLSSMQVEGGAKNPTFSQLYFCQLKPTPADLANEPNEPLLWYWSGCVVARARDIVAILTAVLILVELAWSLKEAYLKENKAVHRELLDAVSIDENCEKI